MTVTLPKMLQFRMTKCRNRIRENNSGICCVHIAFQSQRSSVQSQKSCSHGKCNGKDNISTSFFTHIPQLLHIWMGFKIKINFIAPQVRNLICTIQKTTQLPTKRKLHLQEKTRVSSKIHVHYNRWFTFSKAAAVQYGSPASPLLISQTKISLPQKHWKLCL